FWNPSLKAFVQSPGSTTLDASALLMPLIKFISPTDARWISTFRAIEQELVSDSLVYRYRVDDRFSDGLTGTEGTFSMCSFWYVECLSRLGDLEQARFYFEKMLGYANHLGLYGEELGPRGQHLGNFPQAFTHLALISAAYDLDRRLDVTGTGHSERRISCGVTAVLRLNGRPYRGGWSHAHPPSSSPRPRMHRDRAPTARDG